MADLPKAAAVKSTPEISSASAAAPPKAVPVKAADTMVPLGMTANGGIVLSSFQPSVASLAIVLGPHLKRNTDISNLFPLPAGLSLKRSDTLQLQLRLAPFFARKLKRVFGYVAEIKLTSGEGTRTPAQLQVALRVPWRYGAQPHEKELSWMLVRAIAFTSKACFETPGRVVLVT